MYTAAICRSSSIGSFCCFSIEFRPALPHFGHTPSTYIAASCSLLSCSCTDSQCWFHTSHLKCRTHLVALWAYTVYVHCRQLPLRLVQLRRRLAALSPRVARRRRWRLWLPWHLWLCSLPARDVTARLLFSCTPCSVRYGTPESLGCTGLFPPDRILTWAWLWWRQACPRHLLGPAAAAAHGSVRCCIVAAQQF